MKSELIYSKSGEFGSFAVHIEGLSSLMRFLGKSDPEMRKAIQQGLKEAASPILRKARANAQKIADDGTYASSLSIKSYATGTVKLASNDVAAGVKEFARRGATYAPKPSDKRINARKMKSFPVGVPRRANPPRVMIPAVDDSIGEVKTRIEENLERVLAGAQNG